MRCAQQGAGLGARVTAAVGPAVERAHQIASGATRLLRGQSATVLEDERLPVTAYVGDQVDAAWRANQRASAGLLRQRVVVADLWHGAHVAHIAGLNLEDLFLFGAIDGLVKITADG